MLSDAKIRAAKAREKPWRLGDSGQLYLQISPAGGKHWRMNYSFGRNAQGKPTQKTLSFGSWPAVSLADARALRDEAKRLLAAGRDPGVERRSAERAEALRQQSRFRSVAEAWFELNSGWSLERLRAWADAHDGHWSHGQATHWTTDALARWSSVHAGDVLQSLERDVFPELGERPVDEIRAPDVLALLQAVERRGALETAHRLRQRISAVFLYAIAAGLCDADPAAGVGRILKPVPVAKRQPSIVDGAQDQDERLRRVRQMLIDCDAERCRAQTKIALKLLALTAVRPGELAGARWEEFVDLEGEQPCWIIPAERMKGTKARKTAHIVPLAPQAVELLATLRRLTGRVALCFPGERHAHRPISENTLRALLIRAGYYQRHVPHGFRAAFSTYMNERPDRLPGDREVIDLMLAHTPQRQDSRSGSLSAVEGAYNRALYMPRRRELARIWADDLLRDFWSADIHLGAPIRYAPNGPGRMRQG